MPRLLLILALVAIAFWVFTIVDCAVQHPTRHRGVSKPAWLVIVVLLPVLGGILWFAVGRTRRAVMLQRIAPDDDPEFLGTIGTRSEQDERIRRLEEELAQLDSNDQDPRWTDLGTPGKTAAQPEPEQKPSTPSPSEDDDDARGHRGAVG